ncbi:hypothetical protein ACQR13_20925 [Bradyrhizobium sp. HKCCYLRH3059]|uniref:hypothetical protein n=1 Tax=Bradyrhizobium sp. HKCCYLRH3059 TaxID=3420745 RepID=UPI003EBED49E
MIAVFCAGTSVSFFTLPLWVTFAIAVAREGQRSDWIGLFGTMAGSVVTGVVAAAAIYFATRGIRDQISAALYSREEDRLEAELPGLLQVQSLLIPYLWEHKELRRSLESGRGLSQRYLQLESLDAIAARLPNVKDETRRTVAHLLFQAIDNARVLEQAVGIYVKAKATARSRSEFEIDERTVDTAEECFETSSQMLERYTLSVNRRIQEIEDLRLAYRKAISRLLPDHD